MSKEEPKQKKQKFSLWALFAKIGGKIAPVLLKSAKAFKFLKFGLAIASFAGYAYLFTWKFALLIMVALAWHESGHVWAMKRMGIKTKGFYFIPFIGGAAVATENFKTYGQNSYIAIMGPIWGLVLAAASFVAYLITGYPMLAAAASWMAMINLFNLLPIMPLDGGQLMRGIAFSIGRKLGIAFLIVSWLLCIFLTIKFKLGLLAFFVFLGAFDIVYELLRRRRERKFREEIETREREFAEKMKKKWGDQYERVFGRLNEFNAAAKIKEEPQPTPLQGKQFFWTVASYVLTALLLILIVKFTAHVPGGDLAANFLADK
jgi:Zn-dependent protease